MRHAKIIQFQLDRSTQLDRVVIYALDADGTLWRNVDINSANGWNAVPGPTIRQHEHETHAIELRKVHDISERKQH